MKSLIDTLLQAPIPTRLILQENTVSASRLSHDNGNGHQIANSTTETNIVARVILRINFYSGFMSKSKKLILKIYYSVFVSLRPFNQESFKVYLLFALYFTRPFHSENFY